MENKQSAEQLKSEGTSAYQQLDFAKAVDLYGKAHELEPENPVYLSNRAAAYLEVGNYEATIKDCEEALKRKGNFCSAFDVAIVDDTLKSKIIIRLFKSYFYLSKYSAALAVIKEIPPESLDAKTKKAKKFCEHFSSSQTNFDIFTLPTIRDEFMFRHDFFSVGNEVAQSALSTPQKDGVSCLQY